jgi:hypothetical protein
MLTEQSETRRRKPTSIRSFCSVLIFSLLMGRIGYAVADEDGAGDERISAHRLTQDQYRRSIADIFGEDIKISARLEPDPRRDGLIAIGVAQASVSASGFEQYDAAAREIAAQVTDPAHRDVLIGCKAPQDGDRCTKDFIIHAGRLLYRRPLQPAEIERFVAFARQGAAAKKELYGGISLSLAAMLESAPFLFRSERFVRSNGDYRLDDYSIATRLSFLIWNAPPDDTLLAAAETGVLGTPAGLRSQVDRLLTSSRFEQGTRAFFSDMLALDELDNLQKDPTIYPRFSANVAADMREQTLRTIVDTLVRRNEDYRVLFTTRRTFLSRSLGLLYGEPVTSRAGWEPHEFAPNDPRAGLLAQPAFLMAHSHPGRSSATLRGKAIRELILCQKVPAPPPNVNFAIVQNVKDPHFATSRQRIAAHNTEPMCAACHKLMDPLGLPLENFDGGAGMRDTENGVRIDLSGEVDGKSFTGAAGLGETLAANPALPSCLVRRIFAYGAGRPADDGASGWLEAIRRRYVAEGLKLRDIVRAVALSDEFYRPLPSEEGTNATVATERSLHPVIDKETHHGS